MRSPRSAPRPADRSDDDLIADFRARSGTVYHPSCTVRMGRDPAASAVDPDLKVRGVEGLRVCDASVFPTLIGGNTNAPSILVGWIVPTDMQEFPIGTADGIFSASIPAAPTPTR